MDRKVFDNEIGKHAESIRTLINDLIEHAAIIVEGNPFNAGLKDAKGLAAEVRKLKIPDRPEA